MEPQPSSCASILRVRRPADKKDTRPSMYGLTMDLPRFEFQVRKDNFAETRIAEAATLPLGDGRARLRIDLFAMTSNNITYAAMGEGELGYWDFFPAKHGWGRPPCWGFAAVEASNVEQVAVGARVYGYFPIGTHLDVTP